GAQAAGRTGGGRHGRSRRRFAGTGCRARADADAGRDQPGQPGPLHPPGWRLRRLRRRRGGEGTDRPARPERARRVGRDQGQDRVPRAPGAVRHRHRTGLGQIQARQRRAAGTGDQGEVGPGFGIRDSGFGKSYRRAVGRGYAPDGSLILAPAALDPGPDGSWSCGRRGRSPDLRDAGVEPRTPSNPVATAEKSHGHTASPLETAAMPIEAALIKPVVDVLMGLFRQGENLRLKSNAEAALREAIRELLLASPDDNRAEARIAIAKAAGILSEDVVLAEDMLKKTRAA